MSELSKRVRVSEAMRRTGYAKLTPKAPPPVVVWRCTAKQPHTVLRVFLNPEGWHVLGQGFRTPLRDWLERTGSEYTVDDVRAGNAALMSGRRVEGVDQSLPFDFDGWPAGFVEVGCRCGAHKIDLAVLADDCRHARETRRPVVRSIG